MVTYLFMVKLDTGILMVFTLSNRQMDQENSGFGLMENKKALQRLKARKVMNG